MGWWPLAVGEAFLDTFDHGKRPPALVMDCRTYTKVRAKTIVPLSMLSDGKWLVV
jgi:hypothetical protein